MEIYLVIYPISKTPMVYDSLEKAKNDFEIWKRLIKETFEIFEEKEMSFKYKFNGILKEVFIYKTIVR